MEDIATMNRRHALVAYVLVACTLVLGLIARAAETRKGSWTVARSDQSGKVSFGLIYRDKHNNSNHQSDWPVSDFKASTFPRPASRTSSSSSRAMRARSTPKVFSTMAKAPASFTSRLTRNTSLG